MRNLLEYPVTKQELLLHLGSERSANDPAITGLCGDMAPLYLDRITKIVTAAFEMCDGFQRRASEKGMGFVTPFPEATKLMQACSLSPDHVVSPLLPVTVHGPCGKDHKNVEELQNCFTCSTILTSK